LPLEDNNKSVNASCAADQRLALLEPGGHAKVVLSVPTSVRRFALWPALLLTIVAVFLVVPAATRASQTLDPNGRLHQQTGFSHSGNLPLDPASAPADTPSSPVPIILATVALPRVAPIRRIDDLLPPAAPVDNVQTFRAPPSGPVS
jgi:hypothetical protein